MLSILFTLEGNIASKLFFGFIVFLLPAIRKLLYFYVYRKTDLLSFKVAGTDRKLYLPAGFSAIPRTQIHIIRKNPFYKQIFPDAIGHSVDIDGNVVESDAT